MKLKNFDFTQKVYLHPEHVVKLKNSGRPFPMTIEVDLTNHCNHRCSFCCWGEDIAVEFGGEQNTISKPNAIDIGSNDAMGNKTIYNWLDDDISKRDVFFYKYPPLEDLKKIGVKAIYLGYYHFWDGYKHYRIAEKHGFKKRAEGTLSGNYLDYDNIDEKLCEINIWLKYINFSN